MTQAFTDANGGYYQTDEVGVPEWAIKLTSCPVAVPPAPTAADKRAAVDVQIATLEQQQLMPRITRETLLAAAVQLAAAQGITEPVLYAAQIAYRKLKDFDTSIAALRAQRDAIV